MSKPFDYRKYEFKRDKVLKDPRSHMEKFKDKLRNPQTGAVVFTMSAIAVFAHPWIGFVSDILLLYNTLYFVWLVFYSRKYELPYKMPKTANRIDPNNKAPGTNKSRPADGILYIGNEEKTNEEIWFTNSDARTHILYLGTTGSGKTEGLKAMVSNALGWGSGYIYIDGKADTALWGSLSALARRFGRDDDLLVLNYMTGNSDGKTASNTINPFSQGSASYLTNLLVSLMPEGGGENQMWKDRAVALISALMPVLTWQRTYQEKVLNINTIRDSLIFKRIIELSRLPEVPERLRKGVRGYLDTLPGYTDSAFNDDGTEKPPAGGPPLDYATIYQQHGYLAMQFTRQLQSLADDYGYIFETPSADIDMMDVVLNRRIVVVLIPALEKSADETANLGKIVASMLKGMMGATLGSTVEGDSDMALENRPTNSSTPFMAVFDEVGYYATNGMAVMAAQARSLGFCLVYAAQDMPALEKRIKEEARSITANCNLKIFGKLEDPTSTKEFFEKTVGETTVIESSTRKQVKAMFGQKKFDDTENYNVTSRAKASYDQLKSFKEGQSIVAFGERIVQTRMFYSDVGKIKSLRINKFVTLEHPDPNGKRGGVEVDAILERMRDKKWTAANASAKTEPSPVISNLVAGFRFARQQRRHPNESACFAVTQCAFTENLINAQDVKPAAVAAQPVQALPPVTEQPMAIPMPQEVVQEKAPALEAMPTFTQDHKVAEAEIAEETPKPVARKEPEVDTGASLSWDALVAGDESDAPSVPEQVNPKVPVEKLEAVPDTQESMNWQDLLAEDEPKEQNLQNIQTGGFGLGGFGGGFGGIGGLSGVSFPAGRYGGVNTPPAAPAKKEESPQQSLFDDVSEQPAAEEKKAADDSGTINWKDLVD
jgi:intracellular multiplication protein IcmO